VSPIADRAVAAGWHPEIERKFLLDRVPDAARAHEPVEIEQGWLDTGPEPVRLRCERSKGGVRYLRTAKRGRGAERVEREEEISEASFEVAWPRTRGRRVRKRRWRIPEGALCWEVDEFRERELALAEVELPAADFPLELPSWLAERVVREVTDEPSYLNVNLAT
jgi:adenylate cyclase